MCPHYDSLKDRKKKDREIARERRNTKREGERESKGEEDNINKRQLGIEVFLCV